jgi:hypothetical protein
VGGGLQTNAGGKFRRDFWFHDLVSRDFVRRLHVRIEEKSVRLERLM